MRLSCSIRIHTRTEMLLPNHLQVTVTFPILQDSEVRTFNSVQHGYSHTTEMFLTCSDVKKLCNLSEVLTQKLDESVSLSSISFSVSPSAMSHARYATLVVARGVGCSGSMPGLAAT